MRRYRIKKKLQEEKLKRDAEALRDENKILNEEVCKLRDELESLKNENKILNEEVRKLQNYLHKLVGGY